MGSVLMPSFVAGGLPVVLTAAEMTQATALLDKRAALGDWQSAAVLKRMVEGRHRQQEIFHFADGTTTGSGFLSRLISKAIPSRTALLPLEEVDRLLPEDLPPGTTPKERRLAVEYLRRLLANRPDLQDKGGIAILREAAFHEYLPQRDFPWHQKGLVRYLVSSSLAGDKSFLTLGKMIVVYQTLNHAALPGSEDLRLKAIEAIFDVWPENPLPELLTFMIQSNGSYSFDSYSLPPHRKQRYFSLLSRQLANQPPADRLACLEELEKVIRKFGWRKGLLSGGEAQNFFLDWLVQIAPLFDAPEEQIRVLVKVWRPFVSSRAANADRFRKATLHPREARLQETLASLPPAQRPLFFEEALRGAVTPQEVQSVFNACFALFHLSYRDILLRRLDTFFSRDSLVTEEAIGLFLKFKLLPDGQLLHAGLSEEALSGLSPTFRILIAMDGRSVPLNPELVEALRCRNDPAGYLAAVTNRLEKSVPFPETRPLLLPLRILLDRPRQERHHSSPVLPMVGYFSQLLDAEEGRRRRQQPQHISTEQRVDLVREAIEAVWHHEGKFSEDFFDFFPRLADWLTPDIRAGLANAKGVVGDLFAFANTGLPLAPEWFTEWQNAADRGLYAEQSEASLRHYVNGGALPIDPSDRELRLAHAAIGSPKGLSFREFRSNMRRDGRVPSLFLNRVFSLELAAEEVSGAIHQQIDKGFLEKGWSDIPKSPEFLAGYLKEILAEPRRHGLAPVLKKMKTALSAEAVAGQTYKSHVDVITGRNAPALAAALLRILSSAADEKCRKRVQVQEVTTRLVLALAWLRADEGFRRNATAFQRAIPSERLFLLFRQTETFYNDPVADVLKLFPNLRSKPVEKYREQIGRQRERIRTVRGAEETVTVRPWASQLAIYFGHVARDCNAGIERQALYGSLAGTLGTDLPFVNERRADFGPHIGLPPPFQVDLLVDGSRIVGLVYLKQAILDGRRMLVMAVQPLPVWKINRQELLKKLVAAFSRVAREEGYDALAFSGVNGQISNDLDFLRAVQAENYSDWKTQETLRGRVLNGNQFILLWEKARLRPNRSFGEAGRENG